MLGEFMYDSSAFEIDKMESHSDSPYGGESDTVPNACQKHDHQDDSYSVCC